MENNAVLFGTIEYEKRMKEQREKQMQLGDTTLKISGDEAFRRRMAMSGMAVPAAPAAASSSSGSPAAAAASSSNEVEVVDVTGLLFFCFLSCLGLH